MLALGEAFAADIRFTPHNLMRFRGPPSVTDADELRVFCHTPSYAEPNGAGADVPLIECGTCHDPHSPNPLFLRLAAQRGTLCLSCHNK